jgi:hypothetical protein
MITVRKLVIGAGALSALASVAHAQSSADATATGSATIIQPIQASSSANLAFGTIVKPTGNTVGTVAITAGGTRSTTNVVAVGGGATAASFSIVGEGAQAYSVTVPPTFDMVSGSSTLTVSTVNNVPASPLGGTIGTAATSTFGVGGSFNLNSATVSGAYTGNIVVTAQYN